MNEVTNRVNEVTSCGGEVTYRADKITNRRNEKRILGRNLTFSFSQWSILVNFQLKLHLSLSTSLEFST